MNISFYSRYKGDIINIFFIFFITYIFFTYLSYKIYLKSNWEDVKCEPLSIITNNLVNIDNDFNIIDECFINDSFNKKFVTNNQNIFYNYINNLTLLINKIKKENEIVNKKLNKSYNISILKLGQKFNKIDQNKDKLNKKVETNKNNINSIMTNFNDKI